MIDPVPVPFWLRDAVHPLTSKVHLNTLPLHIHELLLSYFFYSVINTIFAPWISRRLLSKRYGAFSAPTQLKWNMHITSLINSASLSLAALYIIFLDAERLNDTWQDRIWGYTGAGGAVQAMGAGYFVWDLQTCATHLKELGIADLVHALVALCVAMLGFRPFGLYYGIQYALVELSTPFVNIHWFLNKLDMAGSKLQVINGVILIVVFASCRLVWGSYMTFTFFGDAWTALNAPSFTSVYSYSAGQQPLVLEQRAAWWVVATFMATHIVIMSLSVYWFRKMIRTLRKHTRSQARQGKHE